MGVAIAVYNAPEIYDAVYSMFVCFAMVSLPVYLPVVFRVTAAGPRVCAEQGSGCDRGQAVVNKVCRGSAVSNVSIQIIDGACQTCWT